MAAFAAVAVVAIGLSACGSTMVTSKSTSTGTAGATPNTSSPTKSNGTTTSTPQTTVAGSTGHPSMWDRPTLDHARTITISASNHDVELSPSQDAVLRCPPNQVTLPSKLVVHGGHDVALENCNLRVTSPDWVAYLKNQTGTLWIHNVHFGGTHLTGGMQMQEPGATVVMRDVLFDRVYGSYHTNHAELIQTWCGPKHLLIDGLTGYTNYQGLFMLPNQWCSTPISLFDLRHVDIDDSKGAYALWLASVKGGLSKMRLNLSDVYVTPPRQRTWRGWWLWPQPPSGTWSHVVAGSPPTGSYVQPSSSGATGIDQNITPTALASELN